MTPDKHISCIFSKVIFWSHDIYGWVEGRTMELVDRLASDTAVLPNFYRDVVWPDARYYKWENQGEVRERNKHHCYLVYQLNTQLLSPKGFVVCYGYFQQEMKVSRAVFE